MKTAPTLSIYVNPAEREKFLASLPEALGDYWSRKPDLDSPELTHRFTRERSWSPVVTLHLQRVESRGFEVVDIVSRQPLSQDERRAILVEFASCFLELFHAKGLQVSVSLDGDVNLHHLLDVKGSRQLEQFLAHADRSFATSDPAIHDMFQAFILHVHRAGLQVKPTAIYFWALDRGFTASVASRLTLQFDSGLEILEAYDGYLEAESTTASAA